MISLCCKVEHFRQNLEYLWEDPAVHFASGRVCAHEWTPIVVDPSDHLAVEVVLTQKCVNDVIADASRGRQ